MSLLYKSISLSVIFAASVYSASFLPISNERLNLVHSALFDTFNPFYQQDTDTTTKHLLQYAKATSFDKTKLYPNVLSALFLLDNLNLLHSRTFIKFYYQFIAPDIVGTNKA